MRPRVLSASWAVGCALLIALPVLAAERTLNVGVLAVQSVDHDQRTWEPIVAELEQRMPGVRLELRAYDHDDLEAAMLSRNVDVVVTNPSEYVAAAERIGLSAPVATIVTRYEGHPLRGFGGAIVVRAGPNEPRTLRDLRGKRIAAVADWSIGEYQAQAYELQSAGIDVTRDVDVVFTGSPGSNGAEALLQGSVDAAFLRGGKLEQLVQQGVVAPGALRVLNPRDLRGYPFQVSTRLYPDWPVAVMPQVDPETTKQLIVALLQAPPAGAWGSSVGIDGFDPPASYASVRELIRALRLPPYDRQPRITLADLWREHRVTLVALAAASFAILGLLVWALVAMSRLARSRREADRNAERLEVERTRLRTLLATMPDLVWLKDADGVFRFCNPRFELLFGAPESRIIGRTDADFVDAELARFFRDRDRAAIEAGTPVVNEEWLEFRQNGYRGLFETVKTAVRDSRGNLLGVLGTARDITGLRAVQAELTERVKEQRCLHAVFELTEDLAQPLPEMLQAVVDRLPAGWLHDDAAVASIEWEGRTYCTANYAEPRSALNAVIRTMAGATGRVSVGYVAAVDQKDEGPFLKEERVLLDAIAKRIGSQIDRRRAEENARERQTIIDAIYTQATDGIALIDATTTRIVECNDAFAAQLGYVRDQLGDRQLRDLPLRHPDGASIDEVFGRAIREGDIQVDSSIALADGSTRHQRVALRVVELKGRKYVSAIQSDITARFVAEQQLAAQRARLENIIAGTNAGTWEWNLQTGAATVNERAAAMLGYTLDEVASFDVAGWERLVHPDDLFISRAAMEAHLDGREPFYTCSVRVRHKDGHYVPVADHGKLASRTPDGQPLVLSGAIFDMTERQEAEDRLRRSEERFRRLFQETRQASVLIAHGHIIDANRAALQMLGLDSLEQVRGKTPVDFSPETQHDGRESDEKAEEMARIALEKGAHDFEWVHRRSDGEGIWTHVLLTALELDGQTVLHVIWRDVTLAKRAQAELDAYRQHLEGLVAERSAELKKSEERYALAFEASNDALWDWDTATGQLYCSPAYYRMLGYEPGEIPSDVHSMWSSRLHPDEKAVVIAKAEEALESGAFEGEFRIRTRDGSYKWVLSRGRVVARDEDGRPTRASGTNTDLTARKELEFALREAKEAAEQAKDASEQANRAKSSFLANMSHEIRTPMNAIVGFTHLLERELHEPGQADKLAKISASARHLLSIINDVLDLSKIEAGRLVLDDVPFNAAALVNEVQSMMSGRAEAKRLRFVVSVDPRLAEVGLTGDELRIRQVLVNFVGNAIKFTDRGCVELRAAVLGLDEHEATLRFEVSDTGIGISPEQQTRLFLPFEQAERSWTRQYGGTGLGLAISRRLVELMHGQIGVNSDAGKGSTFWTVLKLRRGESLARTMQGTPHRQVRPGARVLLVEDNPVNQQVAAETLQSFGVDVTLAHSGQEAIDLFLASRFDLVLMDVQMPGMDGLEATRRLRTFGGAAAVVPILAMTANAFDDDRRQCLAAGMNDHVPKPVDPDVLYATLAKWLGDDVPAGAPARTAGPAPTVASTNKTQIDAEIGLTYTAGKVELYERLLGRFVDLHSADADRLRQTLEAKDRKGAERLLHTLKGVAAMIGALPLRDESARLERLVARGAVLEDGDYASLERSLSTVIEEIGCDPPARRPRPAAQAETDRA